MSRNANLYLYDIVECCDKIISYACGLEYSDFSENSMLKDAIERNVITIGEAANHLPQDMIDQFPDILWKQIIRMRNLLVHVYHEIDSQVVWRVVERDVPRCGLPFMNT